MTLPARADTSPKRKRGRQPTPSLALRACLGYAKLDRERYDGGKPTATCRLVAVLGLLIAIVSTVQCLRRVSPASERVEVVRVTPKSFALDLPPGPVSLGDNQCVLTRDDVAQKVVARVHVTVGDNRIVMLPDGRLEVRSAAEASFTDQPFEPMTKEDIAESLRESGLNGFRTKETRRYLYVYSCSDRFAEVTSRVLETMFSGVVTYAQGQKIDVHPPETPLVVIIFRTPAQFQRYRRMPEGVVAYYNVLTNRVVMYEESEFWRIKPELAIQQSISTIAHEGVHQVLHNIGVQSRLSVWPMWLNEGLAEFFAPTTTDRHLKWKGAGQVNDMRMFELEQYFKNRSADDANGEVVAQTVGAARLTSTGYASAWALTHYLAKNHRTSFFALVRELSGLEPLEVLGPAVAPGVIPENVSLFKRHFGEDLADTERRLLLHLKDLPYRDPFAEWPHFLAMVSVPDGRRFRREANVFRTPEQAERWRREVLAQIPAENRADAQSAVRQFPNRLLAERYARQWLQGG